MAKPVYRTLRDMRDLEAYALTNQWFTIKIFQGKKKWKMLNL